MRKRLKNKAFILLTLAAIAASVLCRDVHGRIQIRAAVR